MVGFECWINNMKSLLFLPSAKHTTTSASVMADFSFRLLQWVTSRRLEALSCSEGYHRTINVLFATYPPLRFCYKPIIQSSAVVLVVSESTTQQRQVYLKPWNQPKGRRSASIRTPPTYVCMAVEQKEAGPPLLYVSQTWGRYIPDRNCQISLLTRKIRSTAMFLNPELNSEFYGCSWSGYGSSPLFKTCSNLSLRIIDHTNCKRKTWYCFERYKIGFYTDFYHTMGCNNTS